MRRAPSVTTDPDGDLNVAGIGLPLPAVVVQDGTVQAMNASARALTDGRGATGQRFADWFDRRVTVALADALASPPDRPLVVRLREIERWVELYPSITPAGGAQLVLLRDATDEQFTRAALDALADSTFLLGADGSNRWRSDRLRQRSGLSDEEAAGTSAGERVHPEDLPLVFDAFASVTEARPLSVVARSRAVDDDERWETIELTVWHRLAHEVLAGYLVQVRNLDEGRTIETALGQADPGLLSLTEAAPVGIAVTDPTGTIVYRNPAARELLGPDLETLGHRDWLDLVRPEHRAEVATAVATALEDGLESSATAAFDTGAAGSGPAWLRLRMAPQSSTSGQPSGVIATIEDVTVQMEARAQTERLTRMLDQSTDLVAVWRPEPWDLLWANAATRRLLGCDRSADHRQVADLFDAVTRARFEGEALTALAEGESWHGDLVVDDPDRGPIPVSVLAVGVRDEAGALDTVALVARDISDLKAAEERMRHLATHDALTGLPNRAMLTDELERAVARHERSDRGLAVLFCDLDGFKPINDRFGHAAGDTVLVTVAERLRSIVRAGDLVARLGGDEFVVLCEATGADGVVTDDLAQRLHDQIERDIDVVEGTVSVGVSVGIGVVPPGTTCPADRVLLLADEAMYEAKATGRGRTVSHRVP